MLLLTITTLFDVINIHLFSGNESATRRVLSAQAFVHIKAFTHRF